jgi:hypothetical protein
MLLTRVENTAVPRLGETETTAKVLELLRS